MKAYRFFAYLIAVQVVLQAAFMAFGVFGETKWIKDDGGVLNKAVFEADEHPEFTGAIGFGLHFMNGMLIPVVALIFLIVSFFAKVADGVKWASIVLLLAIIQVAMGLSGVVWLGPLHGINAFLLLGAALYAGKRAVASTTPVAPSPTTSVVV